MFKLESMIRPPIGTVADIHNLTSPASGVTQKSRWITDTADCLSYLSHHQRDYLKAPDIKVDRHEVPCQTLNDVHIESSERHQYHTYWYGDMTWRVELFIKAFLYTQNLNTTSLTVWFDTAFNENAAINSLHHNLSQQFQKLIKSGVISFRPWSIPQRVFLPSDMEHSDEYGFIDNEDRRGMYPDCEVIADSVQRDSLGKVFLRLDLWGSTAIRDVAARSDIFRFLILHEHGGLYLDMDMILLRDMQPLLASKLSFAERWGTLNGPGDYNTAVLSLQANSSLSSFFLRSGVRNGMFFHPRAMGHHLWKEGRQDELLRFENAAFDPIWPEFAGTREGASPSPHHTKLSQVFEAVSGPQDRDDTNADTFHKPNDRLQEFYEGAFAYHIHNQWSSLPEKGSWLDVIMNAHDNFFLGTTTNQYGECWDVKLGEALAYSKNLS